MWFYFIELWMSSFIEFVLELQNGFANILDYREVHTNEKIQSEQEGSNFGIELELSQEPKQCLCLFQITFKTL